MKTCEFNVVRRDRTDEKHAQKFSKKTCEKQTIWETQALMEEYCMATGFIWPYGPCIQHDNETPRFKKGRGLPISSPTLLW